MLFVWIFAYSYLNVCQCHVYNNNLQVHVKVVVLFQTYKMRFFQRCQFIHKNSYDFKVNYTFFTKFFFIVNNHHLQFSVV